MSIESELQDLAQHNNFSGVALVRGQTGNTAVVVAGMADRANARPIERNTIFSIASGTKSFTALTIMSLIESGQLTLDTTLASVTGAMLSHVDPGVTIEHLLEHSSGVGDHLDEEQLGDIDDHVLGGIPAHQFERPHHYLPLLNHYPQVSPPGDRFVYNNGGYVMLALAAERAGGRPFPQLVNERVFERAGLSHTGFFRSDDPPGGTAIGYLENGRSNVFHLPVIGSGDGGAFTTVDDVMRFWTALFNGDIVSPAMVDAMTAPRHSVEPGKKNYGFGFWINDNRDIVEMEGMDAGVSFFSAWHRPTSSAYAVVANTSSGVWPLKARLATHLQDEVIPSAAT